MTDSQPEAVWVFPEKPRRSRAWLIVVLVVVALAIAGALVFLFFSGGDGPEPDASPSPTASADVSPSPSPSVSPTETAVPVPTPTATPDDPPASPSPPPVTPPDVEAFAAEVGPFLDDALTGLSIAAGSVGMDAALVVETLQGDVGRMSERAVPGSIATAWSDELSRYDDHLSDLHEAYIRDGDPTRPLTAARASVQELRSLIGG